MNKNDKNESVAPDELNALLVLPEEIFLDMVLQLVKKHFDPLVLDNILLTLVQHLGKLPNVLVIHHEGLLVLDNFFLVHGVFIDQLYLLQTSVPIKSKN